MGAVTSQAAKYYVLVVVSKAQCPSPTADGLSIFLRSSSQVIIHTHLNLWCPIPNSCFRGNTRLWTVRRRDKFLFWGFWLESVTDCRRRVGSHLTR